MPKRKSLDQFITEATQLHSGRYDYSMSKYLGAHDKIKIICRIHGQFLQTPRNHLFGRNGQGQGCPPCMMVEKFDNLRLTNDEIDQYLIDNSINITRIGDYKNIGTSIKWQCLQCNNIWHSTPNCIRSGVGCPKCNDTRLTNQDIDNFILDNKLSIKRADTYINSYTKIQWQCLVCHHIWLAKPSDITRHKHTKNGGGSGCPECARGKNEKTVGQTLDLLGIKYLRPVINLNNRKYYPDFYIPSRNLMIEYNGIQHYQPTRFGSASSLDAERNFKKQQKRDDELRQYCAHQKIYLLEIDGRQYKGEHLRNFLIKELI